MEDENFENELREGVRNKLVEIGENLKIDFMLELYRSEVDNIASNFSYNLYVDYHMKGMVYINTNILKNSSVLTFLIFDDRGYDEVNVLAKEMFLEDKLIKIPQNLNKKIICFDGNMDIIMSLNEGEIMENYDLDMLTKEEHDIIKCSFDYLIKFSNKKDKNIN